MDTLQELFESTLRNVYYAEKQIAKTLPKMAKKATSERVAEAFRTHLDQTQSQIARLDKVFELIGAQAKGKKCDGIQGTIKEAEGLMKKAKDHMVRDAAMLSTAQAVEHYKISRYGTLSAWAQKLGLPEAAQLLDETLHEEKDTDEKLDALMRSEINVKADNENLDKDDADDKSKRASAPRLKLSKRSTKQEPSSE
jgi:ferritin-like metal-binding protein YciE